MSQPATLNTGPVLPHSLELEEALLGAVLIDPEKLTDVIALGLVPEDFYSLVSRQVYEAVLATQPSTDLLTIQVVLERRGQLEDTGGRSYLERLVALTATAVHPEAYAQEVRKLAVQRRLIHAAGQIVDMARQGETEPDSLIAEGLRLIDMAGGERPGQHRLMSLYEAAKLQYDRVQKAQELRLAGKSLVIPTGFQDLDILFGGGYQTGEYLLMGARAKVGKSILLLDFTRAADRAGHPAALFSMEMRVWQQAKRALHGAVEGGKQKRGDLDDDDWARLIVAIDGLRSRQIYVDDTPGLSPAVLAAKIRRAKREHGIEVAVVDYMQMMTTGLPGGDRLSETERITYVSRALKTLAMDADVAILAASAVTRQPGNVGGRHMRGGEMVNHDADYVLALNEDEDDGLRLHTFDKPVTLTVEMARDASAGEVRLLLRKKDLCFVPAAVDMTGQPLEEPRYTPF